MSSTKRVTSKNLFNYAAQGKMDEDIKKSLPTFVGMLQFIFGILIYLICYFISTFIWKFDFKIPGEKAIKSAILMGKGFILNNDEEFVKGFRLLCNFGLRVSQSPAIYDKAVNDCVHSEIHVPTFHLGEYSVSVLVHTPKQLDKQVQRPAIIYAHGGGVVGCKASTHKRYLSKLALKSNVVIFNVDYRRAPEVKCPNNVLDFYEVLKYVLSNADILGIDDTKVAISGESGGGYICFGTMVLLAQRNESNIVKLAMPIIPMVDDDSFHSENSFGVVNAILRRIWKLIAEDMETQKSNPLLFPGKASDDILQNMPPTIVWEAEFDMFINEATRLAKRLQSNGRLLEFVVFPGQRHGSWINPRFKCHEAGFDAFSLAVEKYLIE